MSGEIEPNQGNLMHGDKVRALADRLENAGEVDAALTADVVQAIRAAFPDATSLLAAHSALLTSTDAALHVVDETVPAWGIVIKGMATEPDGHWHCMLRETGSPDEDMLGMGTAPTLPRALIAAVLRIAALRVRA